MRGGRCRFHRTKYDQEQEVPLLFQNPMPPNRITAQPISRLQAWKCFQYSLDGNLDFSCATLFIRYLHSAANVPSNLSAPCLQTDARLSIVTLSLVVVLASGDTLNAMASKHGNAYLWLCINGNRLSLARRFLHEECFQILNRLCSVTLESIIIEA